MSKERSNEALIMAGYKGTGKTTICLNLLNVNSKKHIIVDLHDHPAYRHLPIISMNDIVLQPDFNCRIITKNPQLAMELINEHIFNMVVVFEDARRYIKPNMSTKSEAIFINQKQHNLDIICMFHSLSQVPKFLRDIADKVIIFHTRDSYNDVKANFCEDLASLQRDVTNSENKFKFEYLDL